MDNFTIRQIDYKTAMQVVMEKHYLHRKCPCSFAFGLYDENTLKGVIVYGTPSSAPLRKGICGVGEKDNVIELTRLWTNDDLPRNTESWFIGQTIRKVDKEIIVSFADPSQGHIGFVYQATNWIYTGLSAKRTDWTVKGLNKHGQSIADKYTAKEVREVYGDAFSLQPRVQKHRYIFFNCSKKKRKRLLEKLRYPVLPYPKQA